MKTEERQTGGRERLSQNDELNDVFVFSRGDSQHPGDERDSTLFLAPCLYFLFLRSRSTTSPLRRVPLFVHRFASVCSFILQLADLCYSLQGILSFNRGFEKRHAFWNQATSDIPMKYYTHPSFASF